MNESTARPPHDDSADEELSASLAGHSSLPDHDHDHDHDHEGEAPATPEPSADDTEVLDEDSPVLEEIDDSPVRTENS